MPPVGAPSSSFDLHQSDRLNRLRRFRPWTGILLAQPFNSVVGDRLRRDSLRASRVEEIARIELHLDADRDPERAR